MRNWYKQLSAETRAAIAGGFVQGTFVLVGIVLTALIASSAISRELQMAQTIEAVTTYLDGMAEAQVFANGTPGERMGIAKVGAGMARMGSYGDPEIVKAMADIRRCLSEENVLKLFEAFREHVDAEDVNEEDLTRMFDVIDPNADC
jgi:hypothetical protein